MFTTLFKIKVVLEALKGAKTIAQLSTEFGIHAQQIIDRSISHWVIKPRLCGTELV